MELLDKLDYMLYELNNVIDDIYYHIYLEKFDNMFLSNVKRDLVNNLNIKSSDVYNKYKEAVKNYNNYLIELKSKYGEELKGLQPTEFEEEERLKLIDEVKSLTNSYAQILQNNDITGEITDDLFYELTQSEQKEISRINYRKSQIEKQLQEQEKENEQKVKDFEKLIILKKSSILKCFIALNLSK